MNRLNLFLYVLPRRKTQGEKRKLICQAFRASLADIMNSKSTQRVNAFVRVASALPEWAKIKKAIFIFAGGFKYHSSAKAVERYYDETLSVVSYNAKEKAFYMRDGLTPEAFAVATSQYHGIMAFDYDAVSVKAEPRATMDLAPLLKALEKAKDNRHMLSAMDRKALVEIWDAACAALPHKLGGRELTAQDILPKAAAIDGKATVFVEHQTTGGTNMKEVIATVALVCMSCICLIGLGAIVYCMATGY